MPELPEVQTVVSTLELEIKDREIVGMDIIYPRIIEGDPEIFRDKMLHQHFRNFNRRGKYLLFEMDDFTFVSHLRMEGKYFVLDENEETKKHDHIIFYLDDHRKLVYNDVRKFGRMEIVPKDDRYDDFHGLGLEPFDERFDDKYCLEYLNGKNKPIKTMLLDQGFIAGIGNIYADEILSAIKIHPLTMAKDLKKNDCKKLVYETRRILSEAIEAGGTTIRSYTSSLGVTGRFQLNLRVHTLKECPKCKSEIQKITVGGRGTYYCPKCQKLK
ncbi:MAG: DNA-formamidopyrimidine glycosylase [Erysipelotrichaceae bacterium]|nr:DNA-formamidopyrimidine glycosylase [Erysipelotrichaceae bacterium]